MVSHNGTVGHIAPRIREFTYDFAGNPLVILHSDGLTSRWDLAAYPGLASQHPSLIAGVLLRDHRRARDDASVVAVRPRCSRCGMNPRLLLIAIGAETDIVLVRKRTRRLAELLGFEAQDQTRITTAVSEIARNAFEYAGGGQVEFGLIDRQARRRRFVISVQRQGPGIADLPAILDGVAQVGHRHGHRPAGRAAPDGRVPCRYQAGRGHHGARWARSCRARAPPVTAAATARRSPEHWRGRSAGRRWRKSASRTSRSWCRWIS